jgi:nitrate reductase cytochrome c-type subunit
MKQYVHMLVPTLLALVLSLPLVALADDDYEKDALYAEGTPPMVPHTMETNATGESCLVCHLEGKNGAPLSPHAVRVDCVQCHGQGEIKEKKADKKRKKHAEKKKSQEKE